MTIEELQRQVVRQLKDDKGFDITLEQRPAYLMSEAGEVASEVLKLSRDRNGDVGKMSEAERAFVVENLGMEIYDMMWNLCDLVDMAGMDLERAFAKKADLNVGREW